MKKLFFIIAAALLVTGCGSKELSKDEAIKLLRKERGYPHVFDHDIFCGDSHHARNVIDKGLEAKGLVIVHRTAKLRDIGKKPIIDFTEKAKPYLLATPVEDQEYKIQKVKVADEDILEVKSIVSNAENKTAVVVYTTKFNNLTPFSVLLPITSKPEIEHTATFILSDHDGWILQKRQGR